MKPIDGGDAVEVSMLTRLDLKLPILPRWLIDFVSKKLAPQTIPMLAKQVLALKQVAWIISAVITSHHFQANPSEHTTFVGR